MVWDDHVQFKNSPSIVFLMETKEKDDYVKNLKSKL